jgi:hypothetical protein
MRTTASAWLLRAYFPGARSGFDSSRRGASVDVVLGASFVNLPTATEINQAIAVNGAPRPAPGYVPRLMVPGRVR